MCPEESVSEVAFLCSVAQSCPTLWDPHGLQHARLPCPSPTPGWSLLRLMSIESVMPANHLVLCCPFHFLPSIFPSIRVFSNELTLCISESKYWSFSISPSNEYSGLIFFRIDWLGLVVQGTQDSSPTPPLEHNRLRCSAFFMVHKEYSRT